jgi:hypothetical protein
MAKEVYPENYDAFTFSEGFEQVFDGLIVDAYFAVDNSYAPNTLLMHWVVRNLETGEELSNPLKFSCGDGWITKDDGATAWHKEKPIEKMVFNKNSSYGSICLKCLEEFDMGSILLERFDRRGPGFREAKGWVGLKFHFEPVQRSYKGLDEKANRPKIMPVEFLGEEETGKKKKTAKASRESTTKAEAKVESAAEKAKRLLAEKKGKSGKEKTLEEKLTDLAKKSADFEEFVAKALEMSEVMQDEEWLAKVADPEVFYASVMGESEEGGE